MFPRRVLASLRDRHLGPSLSGRVGVKRFQTAPSIWCGMFPRRVLASLRDRHLGPSLSGRVGVKRFQTAPSIWCGMFPRRVLASLRDRHLGPPMMGSGGCGGPIYRDVLAVRLTAGIRTRNGLALSIVPAGTSLHRSAEFVFSPVVFLLCTTRCELHERHKCALTARALLFARSR